MTWPFLGGLEAARGAKPPADTIDFRLALVERRLARMHRVVAEHEPVRMLDRRSQDERRVSIRLEIDGLAGFLEDGQLSRSDRRLRTQAALVDGEPGDRVSVWRHVAPALAVLPPDVQIVDARGRANRARGAAIAAENHARGAVFLHRVGPDALALPPSVLLRRRQS